MAKYESRYKSLGFYVNGELKRFNNGIYVTDDKETIAVLDAITDAICVVEPKATTTKAETTEAKPAAKTSARRASAR